MTDQEDFEGQIRIEDGPELPPSTPEPEQEPSHEGPTGEPDQDQSDGA